MMRNYCSPKATRCISIRSFAAFGLCGFVLALCVGTSSVDAKTWRVGDRLQPWRLHPVSHVMDLGERYKPDFVWGGAHAIEVVVDDDGDGLVDEDRVELVDDDGDGLFNEDAVNGIDDDRDGLVDEDGPDPQRDNDGDGMLNEDGLRTGGLIYDLGLRDAMTQSPFFRHATAAEAEGDPQGTGYGWGDDDRDASFNEDPLDGRDNDGDGLVDEDGPGPAPGIPGSWRLPVFTYEADALSAEERQSLEFLWDSGQNQYVFTDSTTGTTVVAQLEQRQFSPVDWLRPIRLDPSRNIIQLVEDNYLAGVYGNVDPFDSSSYGSNLSGSTHQGDSGHGQIVDGNVFTARAQSQRSSSAGFRMELKGLYYLDLLRLRPRPDFGDRTPTSFQISYGGDLPYHFQERFSVGGALTRFLVVYDFIIPRQIDQARPPVKEYRFDGGALGDPRRVRVLDMRSNMPEGQTWELAEFEAFGHGYALDASYVTEIIDVGTSTPRYRRYFDEEDPTRPIPFERILTKDSNRNNAIDDDEKSSFKLAKQFDHNVPGGSVTWGWARWKGIKEGQDANVQVRVRTGTSLDTHIYTRKVGRGVYSQFLDKSIILDWPTRGSQVDAFSYIALSGLERPTARELHYNMPTNQDGAKGGWSFWSSPFSFEDGAVDENGEGGILLPLPPLTRYIQFRFDFESTENSGISLDYLEFDFSPPFVSRGVVAEIFPDVTEQLGQSVAFQYIIKPDVATADIGFNRIDISVPSPDARIDSLLVDDLPWTRVLAPDALQGDPRAWLDSVQVREDRTFAAATYIDSTTGRATIGIKTRVLKAADFPRGQDRGIEVRLQSPLYKLMTQFDSWVWNDQRTVQLHQPATPGNAADRLPADDIIVTVSGEQKWQTLTLRSVGPNPFTPNGDGINDQVILDLDLFLMTTAADVSLTIFDMAGRLIHTLKPVSTSAGTQQMVWDGRGVTNELVPPGIYTYKLSLDTDEEENRTIFGTFGVVY